MRVPEPSSSALPSRRDAMAWFGIFTAASLLFCTPFVTLGQLSDVPAWGDARLIAWTLAWHARWPVAGGWPFDAPFFQPESNALVNTEPMVALGLAAAPLTAAAGPFVAFNALRILLPATNALAMACLVWYYTRDRWAAFVAGAALGFAYSQIATVYIGLIHLAVLAGFAMAPVYLDRWWHGGRTRDLSTAVAVALVQCLVSWYSAVLMVIVLIVQVGWLVATDTPTLRRTLSRIFALAIAAVVAGGLLWPFARPFLDLKPPAVDELRAFSLEPSYYLVPPADTFAGALMTGTSTPATAWDYRRSYFPGLFAAAAALAGVLGAISVRDLRRLLWALPLGVTGWALSLGPSSASTGWRPFDLLSAVPGVMSFRVPGRMAVLVAFAIAVLAGAAVRSTPSRYRRVVGLLLLAGFIAEGAMVYGPRQLQVELPTPKVFERLSDDAPETALVVPMLADTAAWPAEADYLLFAHERWTPLVNGYGRRTPPLYLAIHDAVSRFPRADLGETLRFYGVSHVVVLRRYDDTRAAAFVAAADASPDFQRVDDIDGDVLYRVRSPEATRR